ncbi:hypothetical protein [Flavobacterium luminosum]|uniref:Uncharacterized protein n=1 Tax=Flavobacterium luminosum TaxID=2949086 RepID=A0ABT0TJR7_9FLAO|nr:hypothetical protein [Flavobacterium sp. HXWNR70]MCL9807754.1 hypothetical protein [Flavobacterium sp. HXWNR70]
MDNITIYKGKKYSLELDEGKANLFSYNLEMYPSIRGLNTEEIDYAYKTRKWVKIRGYEALYNGINEGFVLLDVRPSIDVGILEAKQVDRDTYHARLPISEIESMWEERMPFLNFPFPEGLPLRQDLEIPS